MKYIISIIILLSLSACAKKVDVDIYTCPKLSDGPGVEVEQIAISCPKGKKPIRGGCTLAGDGSIAESKVDVALCK
jgi:hypothetical protein